MPDPFNFDKRNAANAFLEQFSSQNRSSRIDGETMMVRGKSGYLVAYDDRIGSDQCKRWTVAHELGHIFHGHLVHFEKTALQRGTNDEQGKLTGEEYAVLEVEANFFATALLAPKNVLRKIDVCRGDDALYAIMGICDISKMRRRGG